MPSRRTRRWVGVLGPACVLAGRGVHDWEGARELCARTDPLARARTLRTHTHALHTPPPQDIFVTVLGAMGIRKIQAQYATKDRQ